MSLALDLALAVVLLAVLAAQFVIFPATWIGFRDQWRRVSPERRRRGLCGGALALLWVAVVAALTIAQPCRSSGAAADWGDPERIVVNVDTVYAELDPARERTPVPAVLAGIGA